MRVLSLLVLPIAVLACSSDSTGSASERSVTQTIGVEGGTINVDGATVTFAKGALTESKSITIASTDKVPDGYVALSKVFECGPSGTSFAADVTMEMPFTDDGKGPVTMFWTAGPDPSFKDIGGTPANGVMKATVKHFSGGFVGRKKE